MEDDEFEAQRARRKRRGGLVFALILLVYFIANFWFLIH